jgi:hypothetical protein
VKGWPRAFVAASAVIVVGHALFALAGGQADVRFLCGDMPAGFDHLALGLGYVTTYFLVILAAPVLLAAGFLGALARMLSLPIR